MTTRDFPPRPIGAEFNSPEFENWLEKLRNRQNIDDQLALTAPAVGDELLIFDVSADATRKITAANLLTLAGTVTTVSVVTANGVSGSVATPTTTPAITLTLGAITPTSINFGQTALNYYGEGTWTPADGSGAGLSFTNVDAIYQRVGDHCTASARFDYPVTADGSLASYTGLPFTVKNTDAARVGTLAYHSGVTAKFALTLNNTITGAFFAPATAVTNAQMSATVNRVQHIYKVA